ncbi:hypothetical protein VPH35_126141 [Triticum aestivum]|uniref:Uncharacterized protein n=1 Tax=Triticum urartu TaxID=4572 RepID=A0A8R7R6E0_TRIUA
MRRREIDDQAIIMTRNSSNESLPSPSRSNLQIIARHSSTPSSCDPSLLSVRLRLAGVITVVVVSSAYIPNASLRHLLFTSASSSSSWAPAASLENSSWFSSPSPSASIAARTAAASSSDTLSPSVASMQRRSSDAETLPSPSLSKAANTDDTAMIE